MCSPICAPGSPPITGPPVGRWPTWCTSCAASPRPISARWPSTSPRYLRHRRRIPPPLSKPAPRPAPPLAPVPACMRARAPPAIRPAGPSSAYAPSLALNSNVHGVTPDTLIRVILAGVEAFPEHGAMPAFAASFDDTQLTELVTYIRQQFASPPKRHGRTSGGPSPASARPSTSCLSRTAPARHQHQREIRRRAIGDVGERGDALVRHRPPLDIHRVARSPRCVPAHGGSWAGCGPPS